ncbi:MAG TPA: hypothetical protein VKV40_09035 [Ktedonobacteraceae bacterium]|nr:hypothetical protein [Ktedonobacteraceae bacterium]
MQQVEIGDIVLVNQADGTQLPVIVVKVISQTSVIVYSFSIGGSGGSATPIDRGDQPGQWQPKPKH